MCYDTAQLAYRIYRDAVRTQADPEEIKDLFLKWQELEKNNPVQHFHASGFNHPKLVAFDRKEGKLNVDLHDWGLIPHWVKSEDQAREIWDKTLNARGETIFEKPSFKEAAEQSRVIIPLDGFYEHHHKHGRTFPHFISREDGESFLVGGIRSEWLNTVTGELLSTVSIVTTKANDLMSEIHNNPKLKEPRMPLLLNDQDSETWLSGSQSEVQSLIKPNTEQALKSHTVRRLRGKDYVGNSEEVMEEYHYPDLNEQTSLF